MQAEPNDNEDLDLAGDDDREEKPEAEISQSVAAASDAEHLVDLPLVTSDAELSFDEALTLTGRRGARLVMPMGEIGVGKTTVMVELWTQLVGVEAIGGYRCAGSRTAIALEERAHLSRMAAGVGRRSTARTHYNENEGLLHIRVARPDGQVLELLFADYSGERYEHIREGAAAEIELPWAPRADRIMLVVNGAALGASDTREIETDRALRLLYALRAGPLVRSGTRIAVVLARDDEVDSEALAISRPRLDAILVTARDLDPDAVLLRIAARPKNGDSPHGFEELLEWVCADDHAPEPDRVVIPRGARAIARLREGP
jgi:Double-GTPase 2